LSGDHREVAFFSLRIALPHPSFKCFAVTLKVEISRTSSHWSVLLGMLLFLRSTNAQGKLLLVSPQDLESFLCDLDEALSWAARLGVQPSRTRFGSYRKHLGTILEHRIAGNLEVLRSLVPLESNTESRSSSPQISSRSLKLSKGLGDPALRRVFESQSLDLDTRYMNEKVVRRLVISFLNSTSQPTFETESCRCSPVPAKTLSADLRGIRS
jgi:hypothetical protein